MTLIKLGIDFPQPRPHERAPGDSLDPVTRITLDGQGPNGQGSATLEARLALSTLEARIRALSANARRRYWQQRVNERKKRGLRVPLSDRWHLWRAERAWRHSHGAFQPIMASWPGFVNVRPKGRSITADEPLALYLGTTRGGTISVQVVNLEAGDTVTIDERE